MRQRLRSHLRSNVVGYLALFVALGGTATALEANSVGSAQLRPLSVQSTDIAARAVTPSKMADDTVGTRNLRNITVREAGVDIDEFSKKVATVTCAAGETLLSAGTRWTRGGNPADDQGLFVGYTQLVSAGNLQGMSAQGNNFFVRKPGEGETFRFIVQALCLSG